MIHQLVQALNEAAIESDAEVIADIAWLALNLTLNREANAIESDIGRAKVDSTQQISELTAIAERTATVTEDFKTDKRHSFSRDSYTELHALSEVPVLTQQIAGAAPLRTPGASALPGALEIARGLRPLMRRAPARTSFIVDTDATADRIAQSQLRIWDVVMRPASVQWLDAEVIVDSSETMLMWRETVRELQVLLARQGAFANLRVWRLDSSLPSRPRLFAANRIVERNPKELFDSSTRRVVIIVSDCMGAAWFEQRLPEMLETWARQMPVCILQLLPQKLWSQTGLVRTRQARVRSSLPGVSNAQLKNLHPSRWAEFRRMPEVCIPVTWLDRDYIRDWASVVAGRGGASAYAITFTDMPQALRRKRSRHVSPRTLLSNFRELASRQALLLAELFAAAPLTLPIMRLIQRTMVPESRQHHLAEVLNSGILKPELQKAQVNVAEQCPAMQLSVFSSVAMELLRLSVNPDTVRYEFLPGVREKLLDTARVSDSVQVLKMVLSAKVEERIGTVIDFLALLRDPDSTGELIVPEGDRPFADIAGKVLERLGGKYARIARQLRSEPKAQKALGSKDRVEVVGRRVTPRGSESISSAASDRSQRRQGLWDVVQKTRPMSDKQRESLSAMYAETFPELTMYALRLGVPATTLDDLLQETYAHLGQRLDESGVLRDRNGMEVKRPLAYARTALKREYWRSIESGKYISLETRDSEDSVASERLLGGLEQRSVTEFFRADASSRGSIGQELFASLLAKLEPEDRQIFIQRVIEEQSWNDISKQTRHNVEYCKHVFSRAKAKLRYLWKKEIAYKLS